MRLIAECNSNDERRENITRWIGGCRAVTESSYFEDEEWRRRDLLRRDMKRGVELRRERDAEGLKRWGEVREYPLSSRLEGRVKRRIPKTIFFPRDAAMLARSWES